jgi:hypothetical protein
MTYRKEYIGELIRIVVDEGDATRQLATCRGPSKDWTQTVENAELIVAALNARDELAAYVERLADLRSRVADPQRDTYTVALGQLHAVGLIDEATWREALDRPRVQRPRHAREPDLTAAERRAIIMTLRVRMETEGGTFHELLRRALAKLEAS